MKKCFASSILILFALCSFASAQSYTIRVAYDTNLRESASLDSAVIANAPAGTTLQVMGEESRWLRINRNGYDVWMAAWVDHTRADSSAQSASQPHASSPTDNCCHIDRECSTAQQWTDGYFAYQNNQCAAPAQPQLVGSVPPAGNAPSQVDNCCYVDRHCSSEQQWRDGYLAYQSKQCAQPNAPAGNTQRGIAIVGDADFVAYYGQAVDFLKDKLPHRYAYMVGGLSRIEQLRMKSWSHVLTDTRTFYVDWHDGAPSHNRSKIRESAILVHEACHVHRADAGWRVDLCDHAGYTREEVFCREMELAVVKELGAPAQLIESTQAMVERTREGIQTPIPASGC